MLLREVQARPLQGHHLRALRRRGDAAEGAPRADGSHRPRRARLAHLVLQGRPEPHRLPPRHRPARAREGSLLRRLDRHRGRHGEARRRPQRSRGSGQGRGRAGRRRPRRGARRARGSAQAPPRLLREERREGLRRGRRLLDAWSLHVGRGAGAPDARGRAHARRRALRRARPADHDRGREEDPRARPQLRDPRRPPAHAARDRARRRRGRADQGSDRAAREGARQGDRLGEGRGHEAHPPRRRRASLRRPSSTRRTRRSRPASTSRTSRRRGSSETGCSRTRSTRGERGPGHPRARERPLPPHRRQDHEGRSRRDHPVGAQGARDVPRHRVAPRGRARGRGRRGQPARGDVAALPRARAEAHRQRRADLPRAQGPLRLAVRLRRLLPRRHGSGGDPRPAQGARPRRRGRDACARRSARRRARSSSARSSA